MQRNRIHDVPGAPTTEGGKRPLENFESAVPAGWGASTGLSLRSAFSWCQLLRVLTGETAGSAYMEVMRPTPGPETPSRPHLTDPEISFTLLTTHNVFPFQPSASQNAQEVSGRLFGLQNEKSQV